MRSSYSEDRGLLPALTNEPSAGEHENRCHWNRGQQPSAQWRPDKRKRNGAPQEKPTQILFSDSSRPGRDQQPDNKSNPYDQTQHALFEEDAAIFVFNEHRV